MADVVKNPVDYLQSRINETHVKEAEIRVRLGKQGHQITTAKETQRSIEETLEKLQKSLRNLRSPGSFVVSLDTYRKIQALIEKNRVMIRENQGKIAELQKNGKVIELELKQLLATRETLEQKKNEYGRIYQFPGQRRDPPAEGSGSAAR
jgi:peptidoglycan hydrolase CwlO-like protein